MVEGEIVIIYESDIVIVEVSAIDPDTVSVDAGIPGPTGLSAYQQAIKNGFIGTEAQWLESLSLSADIFDPDLVTIYNLNK